MKKNWNVISFEEESWDETVSGFEASDVYYMREYVKAFWLKGDGSPELFYFNNGRTKAINVVMKRDIGTLAYFRGKVEKETWFDLATPYGYGGFLIEGDDLEEVEEAYLEYGKKNHIVSEFVRFHPLLGNWEKVKGLYCTACLGKTVAVQTETKAAVWSNMTSSNRNKVRKAKKNGLKTYWTRTPEIIEPFMELYEETMEKAGAEAYYYFPRAFYESILEDLKYNALWFYTELEGRMAAASIFLFKNGNMHYHLSASRREYQHLAPTNLLLYEAALWAVENGYKRLHLGGGLGAGEDALYKFKKGFNRGADCEFWVGKRIFDKERYDKLVEIRRNGDKEFDLENRYFPLYRG